MTHNEGRTRTAPRILVMSLNRIPTTVVASRALVAGELDPWLADGLSQILHTRASDETQLTFDHECASEHCDEGTKCNKEVDLQAGHHGNQTHEHSD